MRVTRATRRCRPAAKAPTSGEASLFNILPSPAVGATTRVSDFAFGIGFFTPFGGQSSWSENEQFAGNQQFPGAVDGVQRWYSIVGILRSSYASLAAAWQIPDTRLAIGASGNLIVSQVDTLARAPAVGHRLADQRRPLASRRRRAGLELRRRRDVRSDRRYACGSAPSYQSKPNVSGGMVLEGRLENFFSGSRSDDEVELHQDLPDVYPVGRNVQSRARDRAPAFRGLHALERVRAPVSEPCGTNPAK